MTGWAQNTFFFTPVQICSNTGINNVLDELNIEMGLLESVQQRNQLVLQKSLTKGESTHMHTERHC